MTGSACACREGWAGCGPSPAAWGIGLGGPLRGWGRVRPVAAEAVRRQEAACPRRPGRCGAAERLGAGRVDVAPRVVPAAEAMAGGCVPAPRSRPAGGQRSVAGRDRCRVAGGRVGARRPGRRLAAVLSSYSASVSAARFASWRAGRPRSGLVALRPRAPFLPRERGRAFARPSAASVHGGRHRCVPAGRTDRRPDCPREPDPCRRGPTPPRRRRSRASQSSQGGLSGPFGGHGWYPATPSGRPCGGFGGS